MLPFDDDDGDDGEDGYGGNDDDDDDGKPAEVWVVPFNTIIEDCHGHSLSAVT